MSATIQIERTVTETIELTPQKVAELFMNMDSDQQAEFFTHCKAVARQWRKEAKPGEYCLPEMQWYYMRDRLKETRYDEDSGWEFILDLAAPFYNYFSPGWLGH